MTTLADIFCRFGDDYLTEYGDKVLPGHWRAIRDVQRCRTEVLGGQIWFCDNCDEYHYSYHSCKNRHCPQCMNDAAEEWLEKQKELLLPTPYFMATFTLPQGIRACMRSNQKVMYNILFRVSAQALQTLAADRKYVGGTLGMIGVLQTWTRDLIYHPHIHYLIPGGGITDNHRRWRQVKGDFLMRVEPLSIIFRAKFRDAVKKAGLFHQIPKKVWQQNWVVNIIPVDTGESALKYLAPYIFRVVISDRNIIRLNGEKVTFCYKESETGKSKYQALNVLEFIRRFLQHVLPRGFIKVRYYGFFSSRKKGILEIVKKLLGSILCLRTHNKNTKQLRVMHCPVCGDVLTLIGELIRQRSPPIRSYAW